MSKLSSMPTEGSIVIAIIAMLFVLAVILLFYIYVRYGRISRLVRNDAQNSSEFLHRLVVDYADAYRQHGKEVNTPAIISNALSTRLSGLLFIERFLNNAVSLFVTLGLFGTFLGLSLSVTSLTELISSDTSEWLNVLNSVGGGLMSALSGMGVAFYTSLVGVACSIVLTVLRAIVNPETARQKLEVQMELWLDHTVAPTLKTRAAAGGDNQYVNQMIDAMNETTDCMDRTLSDATAAMGRMLDQSKTYLSAFNQTVGKFNDGVRDFNEFNYNLRGTVERMDVSLRDVVTGMREASRSIERSVDR